VKVEITEGINTYSRDGMKEGVTGTVKDEVKDEDVEMEEVKT